MLNSQIRSNDGFATSTWPVGQGGNGDQVIRPGLGTKETNRFRRSRVNGYRNGVGVDREPGQDSQAGGPRPGAFSRCGETEEERSKDAFVHSCKGCGTEHHGIGCVTVTLTVDRMVGKSLEFFSVVRMMTTRQRKVILAVCVGEGGPKDRGKAALP